MALTAGQQAWLEQRIGEEREIVHDGTVVEVSTIDGEDLKLVHVRGGPAGTIAYFAVRPDVEVPLGDSASVRVDGEVTAWREGDGSAAYLIITGEDGEASEVVYPPRTTEEQSAIDAEMAAQIQARQEEEERQRQEDEAEAAAVQNVRDRVRVLRDKPNRTPEDTVEMLNLLADLALDPGR